MSVKLDKTKIAISLTSLFVFFAGIISSGFFYYINGVKNPFGQINATIFLLLAIFTYFFLSYLFYKKFTLDDIVSKITNHTFNDCVSQMIIIFLLSGIFSNITKQIGCSDAMINFATSLVPHSLILFAIFLSSALISTSLGTSFGTVVIMGPIAVTLANSGAFSMIIGASAVISGAYFGDNLSLISDTTIAAIKTQGANLVGKFKTNLKIALPVFILVSIIYIFKAENVITPEKYNNNAQTYMIAPYILVIMLGMMKFNVIFVLLSGILLSYLIGLAGNFTLSELSNFSITGISEISDLVAFTVFIAFLNGIIFDSGIFEIIKKKIVNTSSNGNKKLPFYNFITMILVGSANILTGNNTIAIIIVGDLIHTLSSTFTFKNKNEYFAAITDNFTCGIHGLLPHAPQILLMSSLSGISPFSIAINSYYCFGLVLATIISAFIVNYKNKAVIAQH